MGKHKFIMEQELDSGYMGQDDDGVFDRASIDQDNQQDSFLRILWQAWEKTTGQDHVFVY